MAHFLRMPCHPTLRSMSPDGSCPLCDVVRLIGEPEAGLDDVEAAAAVELATLNRDLALASLAEFGRQAWHELEAVELEWNWHHDALCQNVQGMLEEWLRIRDLRSEMRRTGALRAWRQRWQKMVINICPGTLKSRIVMVFAPAWMWLRCPTWQVCCVSATPENVWRDSQACRDLIGSTWYRETFRPSWTVRLDTDSKEKFELTSGGFRISKGMGGKFTGFHVDCVLMDDPDDAHAVHSEAERESRVSKVQSLSSRWNDKRHMVWIVIQQRVHIDDCTGDLLTRGWMHAQYPLHYRAAARRDTPFFRDPRTVEGESMHAERFPADVVAAARLELGSQGYDAQYECDPQPDGGSMVKLAWFRFFRVSTWTLGTASRPPGADAGEAETLGLRKDGKLDLDFLDATVDASFGSTSDTASEVSIQVIGGKGPKRFVFLDSTKVRTFNETVSDLVDVIAAWSPRFAGVMGVLVEKKANGAAVIETLALHFQGLIAIEPEGGKPARAAAMSPAIESGCVYLLDGAAWLDEYLTGSSSVPAFPHGKRDDRMDALSQAMNHRRADIDAMRLAAKNAAFAGVRARLAHRAGFGFGA